MKLCKVRNLLLILVCSLATLPATAKEILVLGDSLAAAYGIPPEQGWVRLLQERLDAQGSEYQVVNASISGETTSGGLARLPDLLARYSPEYVLIELGANDGLRGTPLVVIEKNLNLLVETVQASGAEPVLIGIQLPPNYGPRYTRAFFELYAKIAEERDLPLVPFLLEGVALDWSLMQSDGLHPTAQAQPMILETVWSVVEGVLNEG